MKMIPMRREICIPVIAGTSGGSDMNLTKEMETYILECQGELRQLIRDLSVIPAPSHHEERRAAFCREWFAAAGFQDP